MAVGHSSSCCIGLQLARRPRPGRQPDPPPAGKPSGRRREAAASTWVGPALAAAHGDVAGDGYREALWARLGDDGLAEMLPDAPTRTLPKLDHLAPLTHPVELASAIAQFDRHPAATPS